MLGATCTLPPPPRPACRSAPVTGMTGRKRPHRTRSSGSGARLPAPSPEDSGRGVAGAEGRARGGYGPPTAWNHPLSGFSSGRVRRSQNGRRRDGENEDDAEEKTTGKMKKNRRARRREGKKEKEGEGKTGPKSGTEIDGFPCFWTTWRHNCMYRWIPL